MHHPKFVYPLVPLDKIFGNLPDPPRVGQPCTFLVKILSRIFNKILLTTKSEPSSDPSLTLVWQSDSNFVDYNHDGDLTGGALYLVLSGRLVQHGAISVPLYAGPSAWRSVTSVTISLLNRQYCSHGFVCLSEPFCMRWPSRVAVWAHSNWFDTSTKSCTKCMSRNASRMSSKWETWPSEPNLSAMQRFCRFNFFISLFRNARCAFSN